MPSANIGSSCGFSSSLVNQPSDLLVTQDCVGVEVELEGVANNVSNRELDLLDPRLSHVNDGSLREGGIEFIFGSPMYGTDVVESLNNLESWLQRYVGEPVVSNRCSVHVHLDVRDLSYHELLSLVVIYLLCEPVFYAVGGEHRRSNMYCIPLGNSIPYLSMISKALNNNDNELRIFNSTIHKDVKYSAINLAPVTRQGSVEFRHRQGEWRAEPLLQWVNMALAIKRYVKGMSQHPVTQWWIDEVVATDYAGFLRNVFHGIDGVVIPDDAEYDTVKLAKRLCVDSTYNHTSPFSHLKPMLTEVDTSYFDRVLSVGKKPSAAIRDFLVQENVTSRIGMLARMVGIDTGNIEELMPSYSNRGVFESDDVGRYIISGKTTATAVPLSIAAGSNWYFPSGSISRVSMGSVRVSIEDDEEDNWITVDLSRALSFEEHVDNLYFYFLDDVGVSVDDFHEAMYHFMSMYVRYLRDVEQQD